MTIQAAFVIGYSPRQSLKLRLAKQMKLRCHHQTDGYVHNAFLQTKCRANLQGDLDLSTDDHLIRFTGLSITPRDTPLVLCNTRNALALQALNTFPGINEANAVALVRIHGRVRTCDTEEGWTGTVHRIARLNARQKLIICADRPAQTRLCRRVGQYCRCWQGLPLLGALGRRGLGGKRGGEGRWDLTATR
jgi:hypothetical protein